MTSTKAPPAGQPAETLTPSRRSDRPITQGIAVSDFVEVADNRKVGGFDKAALEELRDSIRASGVLQPVICRPHPKQAGKYEIADGARRVRAAAAAGEKLIPADVRDLDDAAFAKLLATLNNQREGLHPLDDALTLGRLMRDAKLTVEAVAKETGRPLGEVRSLMALLNLGKAAWAALATEGLTAAHGAILARLHMPKDQDAAVRYCLFEEYDPKQRRRRVATPTELDHWLRTSFLLDLTRSPWKLDDAALVSAAGPCSACPKRSGNQPGLFAGEEAMTCTDRACHATKVAAFLAVGRAALVKGGKPFLEIDPTYNAQPVKGSLSRNQFVEVEGKKDRCPSTRPGLVVNGPAIGIGKVIEVCADAKCPKHKPMLAGVSSAGAARVNDDQRAAEKKNRLEVAVRAAIFAAVREKVEPVVDSEAVLTGYLAEMTSDGLRRLIPAMGWKRPKGQDAGTFARAQAKALKNNHAARCRLLNVLPLLGDLIVFVHAPRSPELLLAAAKRLKVDAAGIRKQVTAAAAAKKKPKAVKPAAAKKPAKKKAPARG